jgi:transcriptional activator SPT7
MRWWLILQNHPLRPMAHAMLHTTAQLADLIPDITIRTRAEVEAEEAAADAEDDAHSEDEKPVKSSRKAGGFSSKGVSKKGGSSMMRGPLHEELENKLLNGVREGSIAGSQDGRSSSQVNGIYTTPPPGGTPMGDLEPQLDPAQVAQQAREEGGNDSDEGDVLSKEWSSKTQQARAKYALRRHKLLRKPLGEEEQGLVRTKKGMSKFKEWDDRTYDVVRFKEPEVEVDPEAEDVLANDEEDAEEDQFLGEYDVASGTLKGLTDLDDESIKELYARDANRPE